MGLRLMEKLTQKKIIDISTKLSYNLLDLLKYLNINDFIEYDNRISFCCPVHGGDNPEGCAIFKTGVWQCWTRQCHEDFQKSMFGFVRGVLAYKHNRKVSLTETAEFCDKFLNNHDIGDIQITTKKLDVFEIFTKKPENNQTNISRESVRSKLDIPSKYFIERGFLPETLNTFDVGLCCEQDKPMSNRVVVPIYDENFKYVGCVGRAVDDTKPKWLHSKGFKKSVLYGLNLAKVNIMESECAILVEGQGDVWRMHEAGFKQTVGIFGCGISDDQLLLLENSGALNLIILTDSDDAGNKAYQQIVKKCGRRFNYYRPIISAKDVGEMTIEEIKTQLQPQLQGVI